jgi:hypothetical protein
MPIAHWQISVVIDGRSIVEAYTKRRWPPDFSNSPPTGVDDVAKYENEERRDTYSPEHGSGNPHLRPGELRTSEVWRSQKPAKQLKPKTK